MTAVAATFTAMAALAIAAWDNVQTREHNRLSVTPRLTIDMSEESNVTRISVRNDGIGPALVDRMVIRFTSSGETIESESWRQVAPAIMAAGHTIHSLWRFSPGDAIGIDREFNLLAVIEGSADSDPMPLDEFLRQLGIRIEYQSIYGETWVSSFNWPE